MANWGPREAQTGIIQPQYFGDKAVVHARNDALCRNELDDTVNDFNGLSGNMVNPLTDSSMQFFRILGITHFWKQDEIPDANNLMTDLLTGLQETDLGYVYVLKGGRAGIELYMGVNEERTQNLQNLIMSLFPAAEMKPAVWEQIIPEDINGGGIITGLPTNKMTAAQNADKRLQIDQLLRGMNGRNFLYVIFANPMDSGDVKVAHSKILQEMSVVSEYQQESKTSTYGTAIQKQNFEHVKYFENLQALKNVYEDGLIHGMWYTIGYYATYGADMNSVSIGNLIRSTFMGPESKPDKVRTDNTIPPRALTLLVRKICMPEDRMSDQAFHLLGHGTNLDESLDYEYLTILSSSQLGVVAGMPVKEYPGFYVDDYVEFDSASRTAGKLKEPVAIGSIRQAGRGMLIDENDETYNPYYIEKDDYTRHCLIIGITGGGKTNTSKSLIRTLWLNRELEKKIPFLVIESAKREYWELRRLKGFEDLTVYTLGSDDRETGIPYRLNPFECQPNVALQTHIDSVLSTFKAAFELYPPMPYVLETSVYAVYEDRGWNIINSKNDYGLTRYPTMSDLYDKIAYIVDNMGYDKEVSSNLKSALEARVHSLMIGGKGAMLNTPKSIPIGTLLDKPTVLELEDIGDDETKSFVIGILMTQLYEYRKSTMGKKGGAKKLKHVLMIEEAHRLLKNVQASGEGNSAQAKSVEFFCNMLAEIRTYGQAIFIADQVPTKLAPDTLKNTNLKIIHRTVAREDREFVGYAMNMKEDQISFLSSLRRGYAAVYAEGDNAPKYVKLPYVADDPELKKLTRDDIIGEIRARVAGNYEKDLGHSCACTYCERAYSENGEFRCKYYEAARNLVSRKRSALLHACEERNFEPVLMVNLFNAEYFKGLTSDPFARLCILGQILEPFQKITRGKKKVVLSDCLKLMKEKEQK